MRKWCAKNALPYNAPRVDAPEASSEADPESSPLRTASRESGAENRDENASLNGPEAKASHGVRCDDRTRLADYYDVAQEGANEVASVSRSASSAEEMQRKLSLLQQFQRRAAAAAEPSARTTSSALATRLATELAGTSAQSKKPESSCGVTRPRGRAPNDKATGKPMCWDEATGKRKSGATTSSSSARPTPSTPAAELSRSPGPLLVSAMPAMPQTSPYQWISYDAATERFVVKRKIAAGIHKIIGRCVSFVASPSAQSTSPHRAHRTQRSSTTLKEAEAKLLEYCKVNNISPEMRRRPSDLPQLWLKTKLPQQQQLLLQPEPQPEPPQKSREQEQQRQKLTNARPDVQEKAPKRARYSTNFSSS